MAEVTKVQLASLSPAELARLGRTPTLISTSWHTRTTLSSLGGTISAGTPERGGSAHGASRLTGNSVGNTVTSLSVVRMLAKVWGGHSDTQIRVSSMWLEPKMAD